MKHLLAYLFLVLAGLPNGVAQESSIFMSEDKGTESGGGGTGVYKQEGLILLDLYLLNNSFTDIYREETLQETEAFAANILKEWMNLPTGFVGAMALAAFQNTVHWQFVDEIFPLIPKYHLPEEHAHMQSTLFTIAKYTGKYHQDPNKNTFTVDISNSAWQKAGLWSRRALLIHEALRHLQFSWSPNEDFFDEKTLQQATAILTLCLPDPKLDMFVHFLTHQHRDVAEREYGTFESIVQERCSQR